MIFALDLGSRHTAAVLAPAVLPLVVAPGDAVTIPTDPADLARAVAVVRQILDGGDIEAVILEIAPRFFAPKNVTPKAHASMSEAYTVCRVLADRIEMACVERKILCVRMARQTWAHRVVPHSRGVTNEAAAAGVRAHTEPVSWGALTDEHQRDAGGALIGYLLGLEVAAATAERMSRRKPATPRPLVRIVGFMPSVSAADRVVDALRVHGRPMSQSVLAVRLAMDPNRLSMVLPKVLKTGRVVRPQRGIYALP